MKQQWQNVCKILIIIVISLFISQFELRAQHRITGIVISSKDNTPMPYASVYLKKSHKGTLTNENGEFVLKSINVKDSLIIRYMGFIEKRISILSDTKLYILLEPDSFNIKGVEITDYSSKTIATIIKRAISKQKELYGTDICKSYATILSFQNDSILREAVETFYSTSVNSYGISNNAYKNGIISNVLNTKDKSFHTLDLFSYIIPSIKIFYSQLPSDRNYISNKLIENIQLNSPIKMYFIHSIVKNYFLRARDISNNIIRINYAKKDNENENGELIIDKRSDVLIRISINNFYEDRLPIYSPNPNFFIQKLYQNTEIVFDSLSVSNFPKLVITNWKFDYVRKSTLEIEKMEVLSKQLLYDYNTQFSHPLPQKLTSFNDYDLISFVPVRPNLWNDEAVILKTEKVKKLTDKMNMGNNIIFNSSLDSWHDNWKFNWKRVKLIKKKRYHKETPIIIEAFIYLDYYMTDSNNYNFITSIVFDYSKCKITQNQKSKALKKQIEYFFNKGNIIAKQLKTKLDGLKYPTDKQIEIEYQKADNELSILKKKIFGEGFERAFDTTTIWHQE